MAGDWTTGGPIVGREAEVAALADFLGGDGRALVVTGEPGIGKTTLWEAGIEAAHERGLRVLGARATEPELGLAYVALSDLLDGVDREAVTGVAPPQLRALDVALRRAEPGDEPPDDLAVSVGFTSVLRALAEQGPVLVALDDVSWLDRSSAEVLSFAVRRLRGAPVRFLMSRRPGEPSQLERSFEHVAPARLDVGPLSLGATRVLLAARLDLSPPRRVLLRVHEVSQGNPLFALELARSIVERGLPEIGAELPLPDLIDDLFGDRLARLAEPVRRSLLAVALTGGLGLYELGALVEPPAIEEAAVAGLLVIENHRVRAAHPLLAAAARNRATPGEQRQLHLALAERAGDETLRARHLALAARTHDRELAATLTEAAARAIARGAAHDAVELAERALALTPPDASEHSERLLELGRYLIVAGELPSARELLEPKVEELPAGRIRGRAYLLLGECNDGADHWQHLLERALAESDDEPELRSTTLSTMATLLAVVRFQRLDDADAIATEALEAASSVGPELERWALCALAWVRLLRGRPFDDLLDRFPTAPQGASLYENAIERVEGTRLVVRGQTEEARALFQRLRDLAEARGEARSGAVMHFGLCDIELRAGNANAASALMKEAEEWASFEDFEYERAPRLAILEAVRGNNGEAERWAAETISRAEVTKACRDHFEGRRARGIAALHAREPASAADALRPIWEHIVREGIEEPGVWPMAPDLVEALVELGEIDEAAVVTDWLQRVADEQAHPWGLASANRCRGLLGCLSDSYPEAAATLLARAAGDYGALGMRFDQARSLLIAGRMQRRFKKWAAARASLEGAAGVFGSLGCSGWAEQARGELHRVSARRPTSAGSLTESEERVARLAAAGLSNKEIAAQLVISVHTVEKHLSHAYQKLGVRSRSRLAARLSAPA